MLALQLDFSIKEEACMKYLNAQVILPDALVKELQNYVQGGYIYVPAKALGRSFRLLARIGTA